MSLVVCNYDHVFQNGPAIKAQICRVAGWLCGSLPMGPVPTIVGIVSWDLGELEFEATFWPAAYLFFLGVAVPHPEFLGKSDLARALVIPEKSLRWP